MDEKASEVVLLKTMEKTAHAKAKPVETKGGLKYGSHADAEP
jgi:hypothetical protein